MRTINHPAHAPHPGWCAGPAAAPSRDRFCQWGQMQHVTCAQCPSGVTAKLPEGKGAFCCQIIRHPQTRRAQAEITAHAVTLNIAARRASRPNAENGLFIAARRPTSAQWLRGHRQLRVAVEFQRRAAEGDLSAAAPSSLPSRRLPRRSARLSTIGPEGGHPDGPVARAPRIILHRGLRPGAEHLSVKPDSPASLNSGSTARRGWAGKVKICCK